jgi:RNA polymerase sigma factor (sigma-70 family)
MPIDASHPGLTNRVSDITLASRAAAGNDAAFAHLYQRHQLPVYRYCRRLLRCPEDAADATQQTFLYMHRRLAKGSAPDANVRGYLFRVAQRASFEVHERRKAQEALAERSDLRHRVIAIHPDHASAIVTADAVRHAASSLPERQRAVLMMREVEDLTYEDIAERLGMNENAVAQLLHRARKRLVRELSAGGVLETAHPATPLAA